MEMNKTGKKYIRSVKRHLKCSFKTRKKLLDSLKTEISNFESSEPNAEFEDYVNAFGDPKETAAEYMKELGGRERFAYWLPLIVPVCLIVIAVFAYILTLIVIQIYISNTLYSISSPSEIVSQYEFME